MFSNYQQLIDVQASGADREEAARLICNALTAHAIVEEEIFYPTVHEASDELDEAEVEHSTLKELITQIEGMDPDDDLYDAKVKVLGKHVKHHVQEEESEVFTKAQKTNLDMGELGEQLKARKIELLDFDQL